ncbi:galactose-3-O-sulfotransferase 2-like isoform X1 [Branchiostoma floridae]|uniref:Galactose-3-O-sulfotransferase 2-like isoform X1 n=1 Tax=Branchiostoma floridae TaxID=7739 RepID=A0A9J7N9F5_BRAFL|nr:galactose-3-O-sulfotransferase 2-like isoform X1 [Branchiostoma floridae]XP_035696052.1 galactose-3-O-sulfotransferase 2-like isoform X1 [Branchiostoma floridae]
MITLPWRPSVTASLGVCAVVCIGAMYSLVLYGDKYSVPEYPKIFTLPSYSRGLEHPTPCRTCQEHINVTFAKVHKAGGSTVSTILQRFGDLRNLSFVIPRSRVSLGWPYQLKLNATDYRPALDGSFNLLVDHVLFNKTKIQAIMPRDTAYITILRHPFEQLKSAFSWYEVPTKYRIRRGKDPIREFLQQPAKYERNFRTRLPFRYTRNFMAYDLGFTNLSQAGNESAIREFVRQVDSDFDLVLILEHLTESLVLLKRYMCWSLSDILFTPKNTRTYQYKTLGEYPDLVTAHRKWSKVDYALYDLFNATLWAKIERQGPDFYREVYHFEDMRTKVVQFCDVAESSWKLQIPASKWNKKFLVDAEFCSRLRLPQTTYMTNLKEKYDAQKRTSRQQKRVPASVYCFSGTGNYRFVAQKNIIDS